MTLFRKGTHLQTFRHFLEKYEKLDERLLAEPVNHYEIKHILWVIYNYLCEREFEEIKERERKKSK